MYEMIDLTNFSSSLEVWFQGFIAWFNNTKVVFHVLVVNEPIKPLGQIWQSISRSLIKYGLEAENEAGSDIDVSKTEVISSYNPFPIMKVSIELLSNALCFMDLSTISFRIQVF